MDYELKPAPIDDSVQAPQFLSNLLGMIRTVSFLPTTAPNRLIDQFVFFDNGASRILCFYDTYNKRWLQITATII
jgi:hypothetical protein